MRRAVSGGGETCQLDGLPPRRHHYTVALRRDPVRSMSQAAIPRAHGVDPFREPLLDPTRQTASRYRRADAKGSPTLQRSVANVR